MGPSFAAGHPEGSRVGEETVLHLRDVVFVTLRILAVYWFIRALLTMIEVTNYYMIPLIFDSRMGSFTAKWINAFVHSGLFITMAVIGLLLWVYAQRLVPLFLPKESSEEAIEHPAGSVDIHSLQTAAVSVAGIILIVWTLPKMVQVIPNFIQMRGISDAITHPRMKVETYFSLVGYVLQLGLGVFLMFGGRGLVGWLRRIRELGVTKGDDD